MLGVHASWMHRLTNAKAAIGLIRPPAAPAPAAPRPGLLGRSTLRWRAGRQRACRRGRAVVAGVMAPALAASTSLMPVVVTAAAVTAVVAADVASAPAANASVSGNVLVILVNGEASAPEASLLAADGYTVTTATPATLASMSQATFDSYAAVVIGDSSSASACSTTAPSQSSLGGQWQAWVTGNVAMLGTAPEAAAKNAGSGETGADTLITDSVEYAAAAYNSSAQTGTGLYVSLNCGYDTATSGTAVGLLNGVDGIGSSGSLTVQGSPACTDSGTVNTWEADAAGTFGGFTSAQLAAGSAGSWPNPGCPAQTLFDSWPSNFTGLAYDAASNSDVTANFTASDGVTGQPYVLLGTPQPSAATQALSQSQGGDVPFGALAGGAGNEAALGISQATAGDPVNTEDGDFTQDYTDFSIPTFGPSLEFERSYDAQVAEEQEQTGTPGPMGYGWTDNWASSLTTGDPVLGDIYAVAEQSVVDPRSVYMYDGNTYFADAGGNRIEEIPGASGTQWGIKMTAGQAYTIAGSPSGISGASGDGTAMASTLLDAPSSVAVSSAGDLIVADSGNCRVVEIPAATTSTEWGGEIGTMQADELYLIAGRTNDCTTGNDGKESIDSDLDGPTAVSMWNGNLYIADSGNNRVQEVAATGTTSGWGQSMTAGDVYTVAGSSSGTSGASANGAAADDSLLDAPSNVMIGGTGGNMYIADLGNCRAEEIPAAAGSQWGISMSKYDLYTVSGRNGGSCTDGTDNKPATSSNLDYPASVMYANGNLYIADSGNNRIQEIPGASGTQWGQAMTAEDVYTVAGSSAGTYGGTGNGGPADSALLDSPEGVWADASGNLYIADSGNGQIRQVTATTTPAYPIYPASGAITVNQPGGAQVTFTAKVSGSCPSPLVTAGGYCVLPAFGGASLTENTNNDTYTYTYTASPGDDSYTYSSTGQLLSEADTAGDALTVAADYPAPGAATSSSTGGAWPPTSTAITCPSSAASCQTIISASGRALVIGWNGSNNTGQITSVTDPMGRQWTYGYNSADQLVSATDPMTNKTTYTYGDGTTGNALQAGDLLTITEPNAQPGGPSAGHDTVNVYNGSNQVTQQTDPMGWTTTFNYCVDAAVGNCMNTSTGTGSVTVTDPDGNNTVYDYDEGTLAAQADWTGAVGTTLTSETDDIPDTTVAATVSGTCPGNTSGSMLDTASIDGDGNATTYCNNADGNATSTTAPAPNGTAGTTTSAFTSALQDDTCDSTAEATSGATCLQDAGPSAVAPGGVITPSSSAPPEGLAYTLYDNDGNELYTTTGIYLPSGSYEYSQTTYQLFKGNSVTLDGTNITCTYTPPSASLPCATINADGVVTQLAYNAQGDQVSSSTPDGNASGQLATTTDTYDADGEPLTQVAPDGNISGANAGNYTTTTAYNADGEQTSVTLGNGNGYTDTPRTTSYGYDADGNQTTVEDARGYTTTTKYNADDESTLLTDPDGDATLTCYDADGNVTETVPPVGVAANNLTPASCPSAYPADYNPSTKAPLASDATMQSYDADANETAEYTPAPAGQSGYETTTNTYDDDGDLLSTTAPPASNGGSSQVTADTYNTAGQLASQTTGAGTSAGSTVTYCYDPDGDKTSATYGDGNANGVAECETSYPWVSSSSSYPTQAAYQTTYGYDSVGELLSTTTPATSAAPNGATTSSTYDPAGNILTRTDPDGVTTTWTYTPLDKVATISYSGSSAHSVGYTYDASGYKTGMTDATGTSSYTYDQFGELTSTTNGADQTIGYGYNADGQLSSVSYPLPSTATWATTDTVSYGYDNADELTSVTDFNGHVISIGNTADGLPDSVGLGSSGDTITTSYDPTDNPSAITLKNSSSTLQSFTYTDAPDGGILDEADGPGSKSPATYTYDAKGRVASMTPAGGTASASYSFDASGNLTTLPTGASTGYDKAGELTSSTVAGTTTSYSYNADGERLTSAQGSTGITSASWNGASQLTSYSDSAADMSGATYDGDGLRATATSNSGTQKFVWNTVGQLPQLLMDSTNAYIYDGSLAPAEQVNLTTGTITYLLGDLLGSVRGTVNNSGTLTGATSYDAFGNPATTGLTSATPFGYAGAYTDPTGLIYLINRYYDPQTGQFISVDPELSVTGQPYEYASADPVSGNDPTGLAKTLCLTNSSDYCAGSAYVHSQWVGDIINLGISAAGSAIVTIAVEVIKHWLHKKGGGKHEKFREIELEVIGTLNGGEAPAGVQGMCLTDTGGRAKYSTCGSNGTHWIELEPYRGGAVFLSKYFLDKGKDRYLSTPDAKNDARIDIVGRKSNAWLTWSLVTAATL
jgi:RHS repeat-associated protein